MWRRCGGWSCVCARVAVLVSGSVLSRSVDKNMHEGNRKPADPDVVAPAGPTSQRDAPQAAVEPHHHHHRAASYDLTASTPNELLFWMFAAS